VSARGSLVFALCVACGSPPSAAYTREADAALSAQRRGDHLEAAGHYERAAESAKNERDADEARYRAAAAYARGGDTARAAALFGALSSRSDAERASRAAFALVDLAERGGDGARASELRAAAIRRYPSSGLARKALEEQVRYVREHDGVEPALAYLRRESEALAHTELAEALAYRIARELDDAGRAAEARDAYLACASRFPYPRGAYWDDALFRAAKKELVLGAPSAAATHLHRLLAEQEAATITGSYERPRYAEAQLELGRLYRDALGDPTRARRELRAVWLKHPKSTLADDALFEEALLARSLGDRPGTCAPLALLVANLPTSRFAPCAHAMCPELPETGATCHDYLKRAAGLP
jgi:tetratricopeptide (TPR) repeat protein